MQVGPSVDYLVSLPLSKAEAALDPAWYDHYCFAGMGDHFLQFDYTPDQDCTSVLPLQVQPHSTTAGPAQNNNTSLFTDSLR